MCLVDVGQEVVLDQATKDALLQQPADPPAPLIYRAPHSGSAGY